MLDVTGCGRLLYVCLLYLSYTYVQHLLPKSASPVLHKRTAPNFASSELASSLTRTPNTLA